ncbi:hypothetical protein [Amycolatopsis sp.]|uniref:hypothetical protein n=1 Tax=Amycolatopsis sp. TaxID=37632 RepID=UPI002C7FC85F|nr:hypothetical protein [Amycolatopsis sp.]HVV10183.1 hypothetical protein [Amycolatopsis sp.]
MLDSEAIAGPLQTSVHHRLDELARTAGLADDDHATELARREIPLLVQALRAVLAAHEPDARGRCRACRGQATRKLFRRGNRMPCRAYLAVQLRLGTIEAALPHHRHNRTRHHRRTTTHLHSVG